MRNLVGTTLHQYQVQLRIRETGTRILYKAYDTKTFQTVGLDVVKVEVKDPAALYELLQQQAKKNKELSHPNIPLAVDSGIHEGMIFFVYNFAPMHPLRRLFNKTYSWPELARELVPITKSLAAAHAHQIFHGFLNPNSILLDDKKSPVLFDFGVEQIVSRYVSSQLPGSWMNSWGYEYCSREQLKGGTIDPRSDVYAMGMILHEWLTGEVAFLEDSPFATLQKRNVSSTSELTLDKDIPLAVQRLVKKCLAPNPDDRYQTMQELSILLSHGALDLAVTEKMVQNPFLTSQPAAPWKRWGVALLVILLVFAGGGLLFWNNLSPLLNLRAETSQPTAINVSLPVSTKISVTAAATVQQPILPAQEVTRTPAPAQDPYPHFQNTPLPASSHDLEPQLAEEIITVSLWGIGDISRLAASPDGTYLAVGTSTGIFVYDTTGFNLQKHIVTNAGMSALKFSADGSLLAGGDEYGLIRLWSTNSWEETATLSGHRQGILDLAFSADGTRLASVALDETLFQWEIQAEKSPSHVSVPVTEVTSVVFSSDDKMIGTGGNDFKLNLWNAPDLSLLRTITLSSQVVDMEGLSGSMLFAVGGADRQVTLVDIESSTVVARISGIQYPLSSLAVSPDGNLVAGADMNGGLVAWDKSGGLLWRATGAGTTTGAETALGAAHSLVFSQDGKTLYSALRNGTLRAFDAFSGEEIRQAQSLGVHARQIVVSYDSKYAISQDGEGKLKVWEVGRGRTLYELQGEIMEGSPFSPDNKYFAVAADPSTVKVYELATGDEVYTFNGHQGIKAIRFIDQGSMLAAGYEPKMHVWSMASSQEIVTERTYPGNGCTSINALRGAVLLSINKHNHIVTKEENSSTCGLQKPDWMKTYFIDDATGWVAYGGNSKLSVSGVDEMRSEPVEMNGVNRQTVISVAIHPQGSLLAAAFDDHTIHLWNTLSQLEVMRLFGHTSLITDLQFTPNGKLLISTSLDGTIRLWGLPD